MITLEPLTVWEALAVLGSTKDGSCMSEARAKKALRQIGLKESEINEPYPMESMDELIYLMKHPDRVDELSKESMAWTAARN